jgi:hypothetical protein
MTKVKQSPEVSRLLSSLAAELDKHLADDDANRIIEAVERLPADATVTLKAMDKAGIKGVLRANLIFQMFATQQQDLVRPHFHAGSMSDVFRSIAGQTPGEAKWDPNIEIDEELALFAEKLLEIDAEDANTGEESLPNGDLSLGPVKDGRLALTIAGVKNTLYIRLDIADQLQNWRYQWGDRGDRLPLGKLTLRSLDRLQQALQANAAEGAENALLATFRRELDEREGGVVEGAIKQLEKMLEKKRGLRKGHLSAVDEALRTVLGDKAVGRTGQDRVNDLAETALKKGK